MELEFATPIQISSCGGAEAEGFGVGAHNSQSPTGRSPNRAPQEHPLDGSKNSPGARPREKAEYERGIISQQHEKLYEKSSGIHLDRA